MARTKSSETKKDVKKSQKEKPNQADDESSSDESSSSVDLKSLPQFHSNTTWPLDSTLEILINYEAVKEVRTVKQQFFPLLYHLTRTDYDSAAKSILFIKPIKKILRDRLQVSRSDAPNKKTPKSAKVQDTSHSNSKITELKDAKTAVLAVLSRIYLRRQEYSKLLWWMKRLDWNSVEKNIVSDKSAAQEDKSQSKVRANLRSKRDSILQGIQESSIVKGHRARKPTSRYHDLTNAVFLREYASSYPKVNSQHSPKEIHKSPVTQNKSPIIQKLPQINKKSPGFSVKFKGKTFTSRANRHHSDNSSDTTSELYVSEPEYELNTSKTKSSKDKQEKQSQNFTSRSKGHSDHSKKVQQSEESPKEHMSKKGSNLTQIKQKGGRGKLPQTACNKNLKEKESHKVNSKPSLERRKGGKGKPNKLTINLPRNSVKTKRARDQSSVERHSEEDLVPSKKKCTKENCNEDSDKNKYTLSDTNPSNLSIVEMENTGRDGPVPVALYMVDDNEEVDETMSPPQVQIENLEGDSNYDECFIKTENVQSANDYSISLEAKSHGSDQVSSNTDIDLESVNSIFREPQVMLNDILSKSIDEIYKATQEKGQGHSDTKNTEEQSSSERENSPIVSQTHRSSGKVTNLRTVDELGTNYPGNSEVGTNHLGNSEVHSSSDSEAIIILDEPTSASGPCPSTSVPGNPESHPASSSTGLSPDTSNIQGTMDNDEYEDIIITKNTEESEDSNLVSGELIQVKQEAIDFPMKPFNSEQKEADAIIIIDDD